MSLSLLLLLCNIDNVVICLPEDMHKVFWQEKLLAMQLLEKVIL
jgi:hypothetical protein